MDNLEMLDNIDGRIQGPMSGFMKQYFGNFQYVRHASSLEIRNAGRVRGRCTLPPAPPAPNDFLTWFSDYTSREVDGARGSWQIESTIAMNAGVGEDQGASMLLTMPCSSSSAQLVEQHVQAIGQFSPLGRVSYRDGLVSLCKTAERVFAHQPTRLFLHGFYMRGSAYELWVFDRSGLYCSEVFHVRKDATQFLTAVFSYQRMTDLELGHSDVIGADEHGRYIRVKDNAVFARGKIYLEEKPMACREGLVGNGTTCYRASAYAAHQRSHIVKFKWRWIRHRPENQLLELAKERGAWGAISMDCYREIEDTATLRKGFRWGPQRRFTRNQPLSESPSGVGLAAHTEETQDYFQNRVLTCVVTSPLGRPLDTFKTMLELLEVMRDAIKCHQSLYRDAKILHQDVSPGNMIILDDRDERQPMGILIDLDSAIELDQGSEEDAGIVGTRPFMAIGILRGECHTYRHDLESFLYVLLWMIITHRRGDPPDGSRLREWSRGGWDDLAARKSLDMEKKKFQDLLGEFPDEFDALKPLAEELRQILFPVREGAMWMGTDCSSEAADKLYGDMVEAFEVAVAKEREKTGPR